MLDGLSEDPIADFSQINSEMALFDPALKQKSQLVIFNKMDVPEVQEKWPKVKKALKLKGYQPMAISALIHQDLQPVLWKVLELVQKAPEPEVTEESLYIVRKMIRMTSTSKWRKVVSGSLARQ
jgi:GTP-binding protein